MEQALTDDVDDGRVRTFSASGDGSGRAWVLLFLLGGIGLLFAGLGGGWSKWLLLAFLPAAGQGLVVLYATSVKVTVDQNGLSKSSVFGSTYFPFTAITEISFSTAKGERSLRVKAGRCALGFSNSMFGKGALAGISMTIRARVPNKRSVAPTPATFGAAQSAAVFASMFGMGGFCLLSLLGLNARFLPSAFGKAALAGASILIALCVTAGFAATCVPPRPPKDSGIRQTRPQVWAIGLMIGAFVGGTAAIMSTGAVDLAALAYTKLVGVPSQQTVTITDHLRGRRSCSRFEVKEYTGLGTPFCASWDFMNRHPIGSKLVVVGVRSPLGVSFRPITETNP